MKVNTQFTLDAIPEKIYAMLKLIEFKPYTRSELLKMMQPTDTSNVLSYIEKNQWVEQNSDDKYILCIDPGCLKDIQTFRREINKHLFEGEKTWYFQFTQWYISQDEQLLRYTLKEIQKNNPTLFMGENDKSILYWRLWSSFLGFGNLQASSKGSKFIPNPYIRILDVLETDKELPRGQNMLFKDFILWLNRKCPELEACIQGQNLTVFLSLALRVLHDMNKIKLDRLQDATDIWNLTRNPYHHIIDQVTNIEIREV